MNRFKHFLITLGILAILLFFGYCYYRYTNFYYGEQFYKDCTLTTQQDAYTFAQGDPLSIPVTVKNHSRVSMTTSSNYYLSYHLLDENGKELDVESVRTDLEIAPFRSQEVSLSFQVPGPGTYQLEADVVREGYYWYADLGGNPITVTVTVR
jgi:hypothetical protein